jgi:hypothetical protein
MRGPAAVVRPATAAWFAAAVALFLVAANLPYAWLMARFGYDDILREPPAQILRAFDSGGDALVLAWLAFAIGALLFIPVALGLRRLLEERGVDGDGAAILGVASAVAQATGLLRWVFVVPFLAATYVRPETEAAERVAILVTFEAVHRLGGMVVGEMIGQLLLAGWTAISIRHLYASGLVPHWLLYVGSMTLPLWLLGQTELLHSVVAKVPAIELTPAAFMLWEAWLAALAAAVLMHARRAADAATNGARIVQ